MSRTQNQFRTAALAILVAAGAGVSVGTPARAQDGGAHSATLPSKAAPPSSAQSATPPKAKASVTDNIKSLGHEITDPNTPKRIKAHEQEAEQRIERRRDAQRKDHGTARPGDMVDVVKNLDAPDSDGAKTKADSKAKAKVDTRPPASAAPATPPAH